MSRAGGNASGDRRPGQIAVGWGVSGRWEWGEGTRLGVGKIPLVAGWGTGRGDKPEPGKLEVGHLGAGGGQWQPHLGQRPERGAWEPQRKSPWPGWLPGQLPLVPTA